MYQVSPCKRDPLWHKFIMLIPFDAHSTCWATSANVRDYYMKAEWAPICITYHLTLPWTRVERTHLQIHRASVTVCYLKMNSNECNFLSCELHTFGSVTSVTHRTFVWNQNYATHNSKNYVRLPSPLHVWHAK